MSTPTIDSPRPPAPAPPTEPTVPDPAPSPPTGTADVMALDPAVERTAGVLAAVAGALAAAAAAWMLAGVFSGSAPRALALAATLIGPLAVALSARSTRPAAVQLAGLGAVVVAAAVAGLVGRTEGSSLGQLVLDSLRGGGLADAPVAFDPGWRVVLVGVSGLLGLGAAGLAAGLRRPRLALAVAAPALAAGTLVQPAGAEVTSAAVALGLLVAAFGVGAAADLVREGASSGRFELGRAARGAGLLAALVVALLVAGRLGILLPAPVEDAVVPPQRPTPSPPLSDRQLFRVTADRPLTWRLGTLDVYDGTAWLTPPFDPARFENLTGAEGAVPTPSVDAVERDGEAETVTATFQIRDLAGRALPSLPNPLAVAPGASLQVDPRTQVVRLSPGKTTGSRTYRVTALAPPSGADLAAAPEPGPELNPFLEIEPPPAEVADLLEALPDVDDFNRLQAARQAYYESVVAAGPGDPVDVTPERVAELLAGREGSPYEIAAGEAILARWVGVPSRLGYGWFGGEREDGDPENAVTVRPKHGATWLEVWFEGHGWVPLVGRPPRAKASLSDAEKANDPSVRPTDRLTVFTYIPVRLAGLRQTAEVVRYWVVRVVPLGGLLALGVTTWPALTKWRRRRARRRWAEANGPRGRVAAAYAEVRDLLTDLGVARAAPTPLETLAAVDDDEEHAQLAWLVTRGLWGDLARDLGAGDAERAEALGASVRRRLLKAQPLGARLAGLLARSSLREPWSIDLPGAPTAAAATRQLGPETERGSRSSSRRSAKRPLLVVGALVFVVGTAVGAAALLAGDGDPSSRVDSIDPSEAELVSLREPVAEGTLLGDVVVRRERVAELPFTEARRTSLVAAARVFSLTVGPDVEGSLQAVSLRADVAERGDEVVADVLDSLAGGGFRPTRFGEERGYSLDLPDQRVAVWFTPDLRGYVLQVTRIGFDRADVLFAAILAGQRETASGGAVDVPVPDPRRRLP